MGFKVKKKSNKIWIDKNIIHFESDLAAWPSGKMGDCQSFILSSNPGVT